MFVNGTNQRYSSPQGLVLKLGLVRALPSPLLPSGPAHGGQESHLCQSGVSTGLPGILGGKQALGGGRVGGCMGL